VSIFTDLVDNGPSGYSEVVGTKVAGEVTMDPEKVRISAPLSPVDLIKLVDSCTLPDLVKHTIKTLIYPYVCSPKSPREDTTT